MTSYEPELGQFAFSNTPWGEFEMQEMVENGIALLGDLVTPLTDAKTDPCGNNGASFENDVFTMRSYCWCDGDLHPEGCPPNFAYRAGPSGHIIFQACWYKYLGRGGSQTKMLSPADWALMMRRCLESIGG